MQVDVNLQQIRYKADKVDTYREALCNLTCRTSMQHEALQMRQQKSKSVLEIIQGMAGTAQQYLPASMEGVLPDAL